ncbi:MAG: signal recognition particle receptor subunit alpha, partial [Phycisphaeraceae bacterium]
MALFGISFNKIKQGLAKTRQLLATDVRVLLRGRVLTDELLDELEAKLLQADIGVKTTTQLVEK